MLFSKKKVNKIKRDRRILLSVHVKFSNQIYYNFCLHMISSIGLFRMERPPKRGKYLQRREIMDKMDHRTKSKKRLKLKILSHL